MSQGLVFDIKRYSINDGPGIRVTIFLKGCPLRCRWCHNPESISPKIQKLFAAAKCIGCGECCRVCPEQACLMTPGGVLTDFSLCTLCGKCAEVCPTLATEMSGRFYSVCDLLGVIEKERPFFDHSGGGVTFSGGEPLLEPDFLVAALDACGRRNIHRAVDTSGYANTETLLRVAEHTDLFLYDLKMMDPAKHKLYTGVDNRLILENLAALADSGAAIQIRVPLIGGINDDDASIVQTAAFVAGLHGEKKLVSLLPFHGVAKGKDIKLGQARNLEEFGEPSPATLSRVTNLFAEHGLTASVGG
jgi:pyruvate formate lyase activating enzyme